MVTQVKPQKPPPLKLSSIVLTNHTVLGLLQNVL